MSHGISRKIHSLSAQNYFICDALSLPLFSQTDIMISILVFLQLISFTFATSCPGELGWLQVGESCYLMSTMQMSWFNAQEVR